MRELGRLGIKLGALLALCAGCGVSERFPVEHVGQQRETLTVATRQAVLGVSDPLSGAAFGAALAFDGDRLVVGAPGDEAAYVFLRQGDQWSEEAKLVAGSGKRELGHAVAIAGDTVIVGAPKDGEVAAEAGAAHVFVREQGAWKEKAKLLAVDAAAGDLYGSAVALSGDEVLVAGTQSGAFASGFAHVYKGAGTVWAEESGVLVPASPSFDDAFGVSVAMSGDTAVIGAYFASIPGVGEAVGAAYVFRRTDGSWKQEARLVGSTATSNALTGRAVALSADGNTILAAAPSLVSASQGTGAVFVFRRGPEGWAEEGKLVAGDAGPGDELGISVALSGDTAVLGSDRFHDGKGPGAVYVFTRSDHTWIRQLRIDETDAMPGDRLGSAVALSGDTVIVGARLAGAMGAAYVYQLRLAKGELCTAATSCESGFCVDGVCCDTACGGGDPDDCQACSTAFNAAANGTCLVLEPDVVCRAPSATCATPTTCDGQSKTCPANPAPVNPPPCDPSGGSTSGSTGGADQPPTEDGCTIRPVAPASPAVLLPLALLAALRRRPRRKTVLPADFSRRF
ncbi:MAG: FG-GAP repeat protein [Minicystis sp.]